MDKRALITGVTGQDGSYLVELLLDKGYKVFGLIRRTATPNLKNLSKTVGRTDFTLINGDVTDFSSLINAINLSQPMEVYNLAAQSHVRISFDEPLHTLRATGEGAVNVFEAVRLIKPDARVYQAGSSEQFGSSRGIAKNGINYQNEETRFLPQSPYACAKILAYHSAGMYRRAYGSHISVGILFNHESERRGENFVTRKITKYVAGLRRYVQFRLGDRFYKIGSEEINKIASEHVKLKLGNLQASRDWGYAPDYVEAMWLMLQQSSPDDYVIATEQTHTVEEFLKLALEKVLLGHCDYKCFVETDPAFLRPGEVNYLCGNASKARNALGWHPSTSFSELIGKMVRHDYESDI